VVEDINTARFNKYLIHEVDVMNQSVCSLHKNRDRAGLVDLSVKFDRDTVSLLYGSELERALRKRANLKANDVAGIAVPTVNQSKALPLHTSRNT
jgi:hypothetical protein